MKALLFFQQFEIRVEVAGEEFRQGDACSCTLSIKNRGATPLSPSTPILSIARGVAKKIKAKDSDAFEILERAESNALGEIAAGESCSLSWTFALDKNCLLSDKANSLYILYGVGDAHEGCGHLQLNVLPHEELEGIIGIFETSFQFLLRGVKTKSGWVAASYKAPQGPGYRTLSELELRLKFEGDGVLLQYLFKVERLEASATTLEVQKKKLEYKQELTREQYMSSAGYVDPQRLEPLIREALSSVTSKFEKAN